MAFQCTHTMGGPAPSLHRESTDSLIKGPSLALTEDVLSKQPGSLAGKRLACVACSMCCILYACSMCCICTARHIEKFVLYVAQRSCTANIAWHAPSETHAGSLRNQLV